MSLRTPDLSFQITANVCLLLVCLSPVQVCARERVCVCDTESRREKEIKKKKKGRCTRLLLFPFKLSCRVTLNFKSNPFALKITVVVDQHNGASKGLSKTSTHTSPLYRLASTFFPLPSLLSYIQASTHGSVRGTQQTERDRGIFPRPGCTKVLD